jgi:hypothetical protein
LETTKLAYGSLGFTVESQSQGWVKEKRGLKPKEPQATFMAPAFRNLI